MRFHDYPKHLEEHYIRRLRETCRQRADRLAAVRTQEEAYGYRQKVRRDISSIFEPLPPRHPLNPRIWRVSEYGDHRIEHLTFESRPGFMVTANLYLPTRPEPPFPGIIVPCGHTANGKTGYANVCVRLAREGYAVLIYDPLNQGERDLYATIETGGLLTRNNPCRGHNVIGRQLHVCGDWLGRWRLWDGIRALDYLADRTEVDTTRLAVTGQSGGGTLSAYLWAMEPRLRTVASSCWCTSYLNDLENAMPADEEQYPPGFLARGLDKIDFFIARAGEPALLLGQEQDFFDDRGLRRGYAELLRLHRLLGGNDDCLLDFDTSVHGYTVPNQLAMLSFFNRIFSKPAPAPDREPPQPDEAKLQVTDQGNVDKAGSRPMNALVSAQVQTAAAGREPVPPDRLAEVIRKVLKVPESDRVPLYRRLFQTARKRACNDQQIHRFVVEFEPGLNCILRHVCRDGTPFRLNPSKVATLYLPNTDSQQELDNETTMAGCEDFWTLDVRGLGEGLFSLEDPQSLYGHDYMLAGHAVMYAESLLGNRLGDVLAVIRLLRAEGVEELRLAGFRQGAILALLAGCLDPGINQVESLEAPDSFLALATAPYTLWPAVNFPRQVLHHFDLPEARTALAARLVKDTRASAVEFA